VTRPSSRSLSPSGGAITRESIRIALDLFNGRHTIDVRAWWKDDVGNLRPVRGGITIAVRHLPALADGLANALDCACALRRIEPASNTNNTKDRTGAERQRRYRQPVRNAVTT
jgi:hypothetical protein